jgi:hypothetical protein
MVRPATIVLLGGPGPGAWGPSLRSGGPKPTGDRPEKPRVSSALYVTGEPVPRGGSESDSSHLRRSRGFAPRLPATGGFHRRLPPGDPEGFRKLLRTVPALRQPWEPGPVSSGWPEDHLAANTPAFTLRKRREPVAEPIGGDGFPRPAALSRPKPASLRTRRRPEGRPDRQAGFEEGYSRELPPTLTPAGTLRSLCVRVPSTCGGTHPAAGADCPPFPRELRINSRPCRPGASPVPHPCGESRVPRRWMGRRTSRSYRAYPRTLSRSPVFG